MDLQICTSSKAMIDRRYRVSNGSPMEKLQRRARLRMRSMNHSSQSLPLYSPYKYSGWKTVYGRSCSSRYLSRTYETMQGGQVLRVGFRLWAAGPYLEMWLIAGVWTNFFGCHLGSSLLPCSGGWYASLVQKT